MDQNKRNKADNTIKQVPAPQLWRQLLGHTLPAILGLLVGGLILYLVWIISHPHFTKTNQGEAQSTATTSAQLASPPPLPVSNVLLLGYGGPQHQGGYLTDTIILASFNKDTKQTTLVSLPRDMWVEVELPSGQVSQTKINSVFALGREYAQQNPDLELDDDLFGGQLAQTAISQIIAQPVQGFIAIDFTSFEQAIDTLGGLQVQVDQTFDDFWYPVAGLEKEICGRSEEDIAALTATMSGYLLEQQFPCRYEPLHFDAGLQLMDGATALKFVRSRHSQQAGNDFSRSLRQRAVLLALSKKLLSLKSWPQIWEAVDNLKKQVSSNLNWLELGQLASTYYDTGAPQIDQLALTDDNYLQASRSHDGQYILVPQAGSNNWEQVQAWLFNELILASNSAEISAN